ncbi:hypothetical protein AB0A63_37460 [Lentzea sp. NPDC042327]|uniref:hypothetical protein n=1 Tax=Lentzea sp. NPDC042327 TaxID=3154801 RepID=UPI00340CAAC9
MDSEAKLDQVLADVLANEQPHPTVVYLRDRPKVGALKLPDHQLKFDIDVPHRVAAMHAMDHRVSRPTMIRCHDPDQAVLSRPR